MRILKVFLSFALLSVPVVMMAKASTTQAAGGNDSKNSTTVPATVDSDGNLLVSQTTVVRPGHTDSVAPAPAKCVFEPVNPADEGPWRYDVTKVIDGITYRLYWRYCPDTTVTTPQWVADPSPREVGESAANKMAKRLPKPTFGSAPPSTNAIVKYDMWLWTDADQFMPVSVTASVTTAAGSMSATAVATPLRLVFDPGEPDSQPMGCAGPGRPWLPSDGDQADSSCMYAYQHSSSISPTGTGMFTARWSIVWEITWTSSTGASGTLYDEYPTTATVDMTVKEVQALVTE